MTVCEEYLQHMNELAFEWHILVWPGLALTGHPFSPLLLDWPTSTSLIARLIRPRFLMAVGTSPGLGIEELACTNDS